MLYLCFSQLVRCPLAARCPSLPTARRGPIAGGRRPLHISLYLWIYISFSIYVFINNIYMCMYTYIYILYNHIYIYILGVCICSSCHCYWKVDPNRVRTKAVPYMYLQTSWGPGSGPPPPKGTCSSRHLKDLEVVPHPPKCYPRWIIKTDRGIQNLRRPNKPRVD